MKAAYKKLKSTLRQFLQSRLLTHSKTDAKMNVDISHWESSTTDNSRYETPRYSRTLPDSHDSGSTEEYLQVHHDLGLPLMDMPSGNLAQTSPSDGFWWPTDVNNSMPSYPAPVRGTNFLDKLNCISAPPQIISWY
jgi:hypothetical protein